MPTITSTEVGDGEVSLHFTPAAVSDWSADVDNPAPFNGGSNVTAMVLTFFNGTDTTTLEVRFWLASAISRVDTYGFGWHGIMRKDGI